MFLLHFSDRLSSRLGSSSFQPNRHQVLQLPVHFDRETISQSVSKVWTLNPQNYRFPQNWTLKNHLQYLVKLILVYQVFLVDQTQLWHSSVLLRNPQNLEHLLLNN